VVASEAEMESLGRELAAGLESGTVLALVGGLGAGKTCLARGIAAGLGCGEPASSPTFALVHEHGGGRLPLRHFDLYRLGSEAELLAIGWDEYLDEGAVLVVEWADRFPGLMPETTRWLRIEPGEGGTRRVSG